MPQVQKPRAGQTDVELDAPQLTMLLDGPVAWARLVSGSGLEQGNERQRQLRGAADGSDTLSASSRRGRATRE
jgi:hypothetical protein